MTAKRRTTAAKDTPSDDTKTAELEARIRQLEADAAEAGNRLLRLAADFDNFKKRARQEQMDTIQYASASMVERLLPVLDDFQRVLEHAPTGLDEGWLKGLRLTYQKLQELLSAQGVETIDSVGNSFDPKLHEAVGSEESTEHPEDTVVRELRRGYKLHDRVLRPALVKVARPPALSAETT